MSNQLNAIQLKVAALKIEDSFFLHPLVDAVEFLESKIKGESFYSFSLGGVEYFVSSLQDSKYAGDHNLYYVYVRDGNMLHQSKEFLKGWEWQFLVNGVDVLNAANYFEVKFGRCDVEYLTERELESEIQSWKEKVLAGEVNSGMATYIQECSSPVKALPDGTWTSR